MRTLRLGLGTRIALTTLFAVVLVQSLNAVTFILLPRPHETVYSGRWLVDSVSNSAKSLFNATVAQRKELAEKLARETGLNIEWRAEPLGRRRPPDDFPGFLKRLQSSLREALASTAKTVVVEPHGGPHGELPGDFRSFIPEGFERSLPTGPLSASEPDIPIFSAFSIVIEGRDGSWLHIEPPRPKFMVPLFNPHLITATTAIVLVTILSIWTARRLLRPLDQLASVARRLGVERQTSPVDTAGLGDFSVIGNAINEMQARIKGFLDERTQILAAISHDLRTSLTRLRLTAEELPECRAKDVLVGNIEEMESMVSATLTFAGDDLKREKSERVDIAALLITVCDSFSDLGARAEYKGPDHLFAICQPTAIRRAIVNIVENAIKYGGCAEVELSDLKDRICVTIADRGPGIPSELVERAFRPFSRLEQSRNRETGGVGLGLTIARDIITAHGGRTELRQRPGGGLLVSLQLPTSVQLTQI